MELQLIFQSIIWNNEEIEEVLEKTSNLIEEIPINSVMERIKYQLRPESPLFTYDEQFALIHNKNKIDTDKTQRNKSRYKVIKIPILFLAYTIGSVAELIASR